MVGTFDSRLTSSGDAEFGNRVASAGFEPVFKPQITMYHPARSSMMSLISTSIRLGRGQEQIRRRHPETFGGWSLFDPRIVLPPTHENLFSILITLYRVHGNIYSGIY